LTLMVFGLREHKDHGFSVPTCSQLANLEDADYCACKLWSPYLNCSLV
jgi:hypothetical protein